MTSRPLPDAMQPLLIQLTDSERIEILKKHAVHSLYCCWVYDRGNYDRSLVCTCGLAAALEEPDDEAE